RSDVLVPLPRGAAARDSGLLPGRRGARGRGARLPGGPRAALRYRRACAIRQPRDLACRRAAPGARGLGISGARRGRTLVPRARRRSSGEDAMTMIQSRVALLLPLLSMVARGTPLRAQMSTPHLSAPAAPTFVI